MPWLILAAEIFSAVVTPFRVLHNRLAAVRTRLGIRLIRIGVHILFERQIAIVVTIVTRFKFRFIVSSHLQSLPVPAKVEDFDARRQKRIHRFQRQHRGRVALGVLWIGMAFQKQTIDTSAGDRRARQHR